MAEVRHAFSAHDGHHAGGSDSLRGDSCACCASWRPLSIIRRLAWIAAPDWGSVLLHLAFISQTDRNVPFSHLGRACNEHAVASHPDCRQKSLSADRSNFSLDGRPGPFFHDLFDAPRRARARCKNRSRACLRSVVSVYHRGDTDSYSQRPIRCYASLCAGDRDCRNSHSGAFGDMASRWSMDYTRLQANKGAGWSDCLLDTPQVQRPRGSGHERRGNRLIPVVSCCACHSFSCGAGHYSQSACLGVGACRVDLHLGNHYGVALWHRYSWWNDSSDSYNNRHKMDSSRVLVAVNKMEAVRTRPEQLYLPGDWSACCSCTYARATRYHVSQAGAVQ